MPERAVGKLFPALWRGCWAVKEVLVVTVVRMQVLTFERSLISHRATICSKWLDIRLTGGEREGVATHRDVESLPPKIRRELWKAGRRCEGNKKWESERGQWTTTAPKWQKGHTGRDADVWMAAVQRPLYFFSPVFIFLSHKVDIHLLSVFLCVVNNSLILITFVLMPTEHVYGFSLGILHYETSVEMNRVGKASQH